MAQTPSFGQELPTGYAPAVVVTLLIGGAEYPLEETDARWLEGVIRTACLDTAGRPWDDEARAALEVADLIDEDLSNGHSPGRIQLGRTSAVGLLHSFHEDVAEVHAHVARSDGVAALYLALRRYARGGV